MNAIAVYCNCNIVKKPKRLTTTGKARNFDWGGAQNRKFCDVSLVTFFGDVITMMSLNLTS